MDLEWKEHNVNLSEFKAFCVEQDANCCGISAHSMLQIHFLEEPSQEAKDAILAKWEVLDDAEDPMCASYKSKEELEDERNLAKQSAKNKLAALGLNAEEIAALVG